MISREFTKDDYWRVKWPLVSFVLSLIVCGALVGGVNTLDATAQAELRDARNALSDARNALNDIEQEEATIIEYIGRYQQIEQEGLFAAEDRLQFQETLAELRSEFKLFPVNLDLGLQTALPLEYPPGRTGPGRAIALQTSRVELRLPLLHENDLANLLGALVEAPGLLQPLSCTLNVNRGGTRTFIYLAQHFTATCALNWYSFRLPPAEEPAR
jgi:hypothetical protein